MIVKLEFDNDNRVNPVSKVDSGNDFDLTKKKIDRYKYLKNKKNRTAEEEEEFKKLDSLSFADMLQEEGLYA